LRPLIPRPTMPISYRCWGCVFVMFLPSDQSFSAFVQCSLRRDRAGGGGSSS
jgi:hypothetical protein